MMLAQAPGAFVEFVGFIEFLKGLARMELSLDLHGKVKCEYLFAEPGPLLFGL